MLSLNVCASTSTKPTQSAGAQKHGAALASSGVLKNKPKTAAQTAQYQTAKQQHEQQLSNLAGPQNTPSAKSSAIPLREMLNDAEAEQPILIIDNE